MRTNIERMEVTWRPITGMKPELANLLEQRLHWILRAWEGTPYMPGQQCKGAGTDCVRFVCGVLDELYKFEPPHPISTLPPDAAMHNRAGAIATMKQIREMFPSTEVEDGFIEPGDVIVVGPHDGGPGHAMLVGPTPNTVWHAAGACVHRTGIGLISGHQKVFRIYRLINRERGAVK